MSRLLLALAALTLVSACGIKGDLERPDPMWNSEDAIRRECERQRDNNEEPDPRCAQYQTGAEPQASVEHEVVVAEIEQVTETAPPLPSRTAIPEIIETPSAQTP
jgi:predicted small lipoprotein YifL